MRRILSIAIVLGLAGLGSAPLSVCALFSSQLAECATPKTQSRCDNMNMDGSGTQLVPASDTSCCSLSQAPIPQSQFKGSDFSPAAPRAVLNTIGHASRVQRLLPVVTVQDLSPPKLQSLL